MSWMERAQDFWKGGCKRPGTFREVGWVLAAHVQATLWQQGRSSAQSCTQGSVSSRLQQYLLSWPGSAAQWPPGLVSWRESTLVQGQGGSVALQLQNFFIHVCHAGTSSRRLKWLLFRDWHRALHPPSWSGISWYRAAAGPCSAEWGGGVQEEELGAALMTVTWSEVAVPSTPWLQGCS